MLKKILLGLGALIILGGGLFYAASVGWLGTVQHAGTPTGGPLPTDALNTKIATQKAAMAGMGEGNPERQILFGDLHVHTTFSADAYLFSLPLMGGEGAHPVADACDFARYCSQLDFWSINDHAEGLSPRHWEETVETIRQCNAVSPDQSNPDMVSYLGWEWTQVGFKREVHYGHKNVILADLDDSDIPDRPIASRTSATANTQSAFGAAGSAAAFAALSYRDSTYLDWATFNNEVASVPACDSAVHVKDQPEGCRDGTVTPAGLFRKLDEWGHRAIVIPHGTTWGLYTPQGSSWDKQLEGEMHNPKWQALMEIHSGHGNSEEYRSWREYEVAEDGSHICPEATSVYLPICQQAGRIIKERCLNAGQDEVSCDAKADEARRLVASADATQPWRVVKDTLVEDWLDAGQCRDCFLPAVNYVPKNAAQYVMALSNFKDIQDDGRPRRFRFGFMGSSDIHTARPGTGYKEYSRAEMTESNNLTRESGALAINARTRPETPSLDLVDLSNATGRAQLVQFTGSEGYLPAVNSMIYTGGLIAVHADGRDRDTIWDAMQDRAVYSTSGPRILLWFDLLNGPGGDVIPMGGALETNRDPIFRVRALGSFKQKPGCPDVSVNALDAERLARLCKGECYNPSDERRPITRIEIIRIKPQAYDGEPIDGLIEDVWKTFDCPGDGNGCDITFTDDEFAGGARDVLYYARAIEAPSDAVNGGTMRCTYDEEGNCIASNVCHGSDLVTPLEDDCLAPVEERAWSSPIFVDYKRDMIAAR